MTRPVGLSTGTVGLVLAWCGGAAIARLTGATPVVIVLSVAAVCWLVAVADAWLAARRIVVGEVTLPALVTQGRTAAIEVELGTTRPVWVRILAERDEIAAGWFTDLDRGVWSAAAVFDRRGVHESIEVRVRTGGLLGLFWWERRAIVAVGGVAVAAAMADGDISVERRSSETDGDHGGRPGAIAGELDGIRPWRDGDSERWVHWTSSLRTGELIVHDRVQRADAEWVVRPRTGTDDADAEAGRARRMLEAALRSGGRASVALGDAEPVRIPDAVAAARWSAQADLGPTPVPRRRRWSRLAAAEPDSPASPWARHWSAAATFIGLVMLVESLGLPRTLLAPIALAVAAATAVSARSLATGEPPPIVVRTVVGVAALFGLALVLASSGRLDGLLAFLRGPLPQVLIILILIHGFDCRDRRTVRVGVGISAVVVMYAAAFRVDDTIGWWLLAWTLCAGVSLSLLARPPSALPRLGTGWGRRLGFVGATAAVTLGVLMVVPVPDGPARLTLPTLIEGAEPIAQPGSLAGPDGDAAGPDDVADAPGADRAPAGQAGAYTGFASTMDTSVRGRLGDEVVLRVRAPAAAFWRGQTFTRFDGRRWHADEGVGALRNGPNVEIPLLFGDLPASPALDYDELVQTFHLEVDMPNLVFHAYRASSIVLDTGVWVRGDGALRASTTLPAGSVYTVVSTRPVVDEDALRREGHVDVRLNARGREWFADHLAVPPSTSPETIALADELAAGARSTYDVVRAFERWMTDNVEYDLDAPLPDPGEDAVHDFLFDTRLGFCEQIASSLVVMLRSQGVPARLATGYVAGTRDRISGVFEVRASDAHAWVEVWFPEIGWQAFDPTSSVPLAADSEVGAVGSGVVASAAGAVRDHATSVLLGFGSVIALGLGCRLVGAAVRRRRRGRWGVLQDRFESGARRLGARPGATNAELASVWPDDRSARSARRIATALDRAAFAPDFDDDDVTFDETKRLVDALPADGPQR